MVLEHFVQIGSAVTIPFFLYNAPDEMQGAKVNAELCLKLIAQLPNFAGVVDLSLDWQFMIELMTDAPRMRPGFQLLAGTELMVSACRHRGDRHVGPARRHCTAAGARAVRPVPRPETVRGAQVQEQIAALRQALKPGGVASLKAAMRVMGRDCGEPRPPVLALDAAAYQKLVGELEAVAALRAEARDW